MSSRCLGMVFPGPHFAYPATAPCAWHCECLKLWVMGWGNGGNDDTIRCEKSMGSVGKGRPIFVYGSKYSQDFGSLLTT
ncbi:uncharacterized protein VTP21DRAFT_8016 [Calcarisporiella thermophila]|uniref:uncharacterized protein n=1 Tax=Calcarisporiella thermophila TaxID=911321 RepID=UPI003744A224